MDGVGCQPVFSVLIASALSPEPVEITVSNPGETAYIDLLLYWFDKVGLAYENVNTTHTTYRFPGNQPPKAFDVTIPQEWSAPAYPLLTALITPDSKLRVTGMDFADPYGDKQVIDALIQMGGAITIDESTGTLEATTSSLHGIEIDMNAMPDQVPTIAIAACFAQGETRIFNAETARWKECDRITAVVTELQKMGATVSEHQDGMTIHQDGSWKLQAADIDGYMDHRMIMAFAVAALATPGTTTITDAQMVQKSFASFIPEMQQAGAQLQLDDTITHDD
jgi:3-phosphoshikimate 1-carboxyvinyltransferase